MSSPVELRILSPLLTQAMYWQFVLTSQISSCVYLFFGPTMLSSANSEVMLSALSFTDGRMPFPVNHGTSSDDLLLKVSFLPCCLFTWKTRLIKGWEACIQHVVAVLTCTSWCCLYHGNKVVLCHRGRYLLSVLIGATRTCNLVGGSQRGAAKTWSVQQVCSGNLNGWVSFLFIPRILLRSADNLQNVKKEKFVFLLWLSASLPETLKWCKEGSLIAHQ